MSDWSIAQSVTRNNNSLLGGDLGLLERGAERDALHVARQVHERLLPDRAALDASRSREAEEHTP